MVESSQAESAELAALKGTTEGELRNKLVEQRKKAEQEASQHKSEIRTVQVFDQQSTVHSSQAARAQLTARAQVASKKRAKQIQDLEKELQAIAAHRKAKQKYDKEMVTPLLILTKIVSLMKCLSGKDAECSSKEGGTEPFSLCRAVP